MTKNPDSLEDPRFQFLRNQLRRQAVPEPSGDFTDRVMNSLHQQQPAGGIKWRSVWSKIAAVLIMLAGAGLWIHRSSSWDEKSPCIEILIANQRPDGGWSADVQQLRSRYDTGVTALAVLALLRSDAPEGEGSRANALRAGLTHLVRQQNRDGRFGPDFSGSSFTHYLATKALQSAESLSDQDPAWFAALEHARQHLPSDNQMAKLNRHLAHPATFPEPWLAAGGSTARTAIQMLAARAQ